MLLPECKPRRIHREIHIMTREQKQAANNPSQDTACFVLFSAACVKNRKSRFKSCTSVLRAVPLAQSILPGNPSLYVCTKYVAVRKFCMKFVILLIWAKCAKSRYLISTAEHKSRVTSYFCVRGPEAVQVYCEWSARAKHFAQ